MYGQSCLTVVEDRESSRVSTISEAVASTLGHGLLDSNGGGYTTETPAENLLVQNNSSISDYSLIRYTLLRGGYGAFYEKQISNLS